MAKQLHAGHAAHAGVLGAILSAQGFQGPRSILEGEQGFFAAMCKGANPMDVLNDTDASWLLHETSLKPYPACRHAHPAIDAALKLHDTCDIDTIEKIEIETYGDALKFCDRPNPHSPIEAKFSLQHSVAATLLYGSPSLDHFEPDMINDEKFKITRNKIAVKQTEQFETAYPAHYGAAVIIDGTKVIAEDAYGDPEKPMSEMAVGDKARMLMAHSGMTKKQSMELIAQTLLLSVDGPFKVYAEKLP